MFDVGLATRHTLQPLQPLLPTRSFCSVLSSVFHLGLLVVIQKLKSLELTNAKKEKKLSLITGKGRIIVEILVLEEIDPYASLKYDAVSSFWFYVAWGHACALIV